MKLSSRRVIAPIVALAAAAVVLTGCSPSTGSPVAGNVGTADGVVKISGPLTDNDAALLQKSWAGWEKANNIKIEYTGSKNFEENIGGAVQQGNAPDLAIFEQPGLIGDLAKRGYVQKLPASVSASVDANFPKQWISYATVNGAQYAAPLLASLNGWVFYSPKEFKSLGVTVPKTWNDLYLLTEKIQSENGDAAPWCDGFQADASSGAAGTDWIEDLVLRQDGPTVYDEWVSHEIPFSDPRIKTAFDDAGQILLDSNFVNAGIGKAKSINTADSADVAKALESGKCAMTHQNSSFVSNLTTASGAQANVSPNGDYWAFMLPSFTTKTTAVTGGGDFVAAFSNDADTVKVQNYLTSQEWARSRVALGGAVSPNINTGAADAPGPLVQKSYNLLDNSATVFRFDASDLMPAVVGSGSFWTGMGDWIKGTPTATVLKDIDAAWPDQ